MQPKSLGYRTDLMMLALQGSDIVGRGDHLVVRTPTQPTFHWGNFLLFADPPAAGDLARWQALSEAEFPGAEHLVFGIDTVDGSTGDLNEIVAAGITVDWSTVLTATTVHEPTRPNRQADMRLLASDDDWRQSIEVRLADDEKSGDTSHQEFLERKTAAMRVLQDAGRGGWFGAFLGDRMVAGLGIFSDGSGVARYQSVDTHPDFRNRGLAGTLVQVAGEYALADLGADTLVIVAEREHPAERLYRSIGFAGSESQIGFARP